MKYTEIAGKDVAELNEMLRRKKMELFELKIKKGTMQLQKTSDIRVARKSIARIMTAINTTKRGA